MERPIVEALAQRTLSEPDPKWTAKPDPGAIALEQQTTPFPFRRMGSLGLGHRIFACSQ
jgi:hypothetical protein